jgi:hypothetical protein
MSPTIHPSVHHSFVQFGSSCRVDSMGDGFFPRLFPFYLTNSLLDPFISFHFILPCPTFGPFNCPNQSHPLAIGNGGKGKQMWEEGIAQVITKVGAIFYLFPSIHWTFMNGCGEGWLFSCWILVNGRAKEGNTKRSESIKNGIDRKAAKWIGRGRKGTLP